ncbi:hypothetical protein LTS18_009387 [Coniosporium uncinatum]|uniref:Uncharacterized protein n=1 Tax=Coniosporium uncinatum TaxID=93489 RepID=A0ACC3D9X5_9PEZI|nr:hypothetical protein LTS18_009387 [Coniosporium uncinatum]
MDDIYGRVNYNLSQDASSDIVANDHQFNNVGDLRHRHHLVRYIYPDVSLVPPVHELDVLRPQMVKTRLQPKPLPSNPEEYAFFTIVQPELQDISPGNLFSFSYGEQRSADGKLIFFTDHETLRSSMNRCTASEGVTILSMVSFRNIVGDLKRRNKRTTTYTSAPDAVEIQTYDFTEAEWTQMLIKKLTNRQTYLVHLVRLIYRSTDRAYHAVAARLNSQNIPRFQTYDWFDPSILTPPLRRSQDYQHLFQPLFHRRNSDTTCPICSEDYLTAPTNEAPVKLRCSHLLGITCAITWLNTNSTCPLCRADLTPYNLPKGRPVILLESLLPKAERHWTVTQPNEPLFFDREYTDSSPSVFIDAASVLHDLGIILHFACARKPAWSLTPAHHLQMRTPPVHWPDAENEADGKALVWPEGKKYFWYTGTDELYNPALYEEMDIAVKVIKKELWALDRFGVQPKALEERFERKFREALRESADAAVLERGGGVVRTRPGWEAFWRVFRRRAINVVRAGQQNAGVDETVVAQGEDEE